jgi:hypothetical protein
MRKLYLPMLCFIAVILFIHAHATPFSNSLNFQRPPGDTTFRIIPSEGNTYGYDILVKNKILIHQPNIPGRPGNKGFAVKGDAEKVAMLIIKKLQHGMMPPATSTKELDSLKIKY